MKYSTPEKLSKIYPYRICAFCLIMVYLQIFPLYSQDSFFDDEEIGETSTASEKSSPLEASGFGLLNVRFWPHKELQQVNTSPVFGFNLKYSASKTELESDLRVNMHTISEYPLDVLNELTMRVYLGNFVLSAGKMKIVWGKGDMLHVLDVFNANDFTDFTIPSYIDRRIGEPMLHFAYNAPIPLRLEAAWSPSMTPDRLALKGPWEPEQIKTIKKRAKDVFLNKNFNDDILYEKLKEKIQETIENTLTQSMPASGKVDVKLPKLSDSEINEIANKFSFLEQLIVKAMLNALNDKTVEVNITEIITPEKIQKIAQDESKRYTDFLRTEFSNKLKDAANKMDGLSMEPFMKIGMNSFLPDMTKIKYGQYGLRLTGSVKSVDMGAQYYYGHYKTPSVDFQKLLTHAVTAKSIKNCIYYDPVHIFGIDLGTAISRFNFRTEFAYYMTYDFKGTNPAVHNNSIQYVLGFDVDIPLNNINVNIQNIGSCILGFKNVKQNNNKNGFDMDWNTAQKSTNNKIVVNISDSWLNDTLTDSITVIWGIEHNDTVIMPRIKYKIKDELYVEGMAAYIYAKDKKSEFSAWKNNHFVQLGVEYRF